MSAVEDDPGHLVRWCRDRGIAATGSTFLSRETYGRYLAELLDTTPVPSGSSLDRLRDEVVDLTDAGTSYMAPWSRRGRQPLRRGPVGAGTGRPGR